MKPSTKAKRMAKASGFDAYYAQAVILWRKDEGVDESDPVKVWPMDETLIQWLVKQL